MRRPLLRAVLIILLSSLLLTGASSSGVAQTGKAPIGPLEDMSVALTMFLIKSLDIGADGVRIAVLRFENEDKCYTKLEKMLWNKLTHHLANHPPIKVIERLKLDAALVELKLGFNDAFDPKTAVEMGKLVQANYVLLGSYSALATYVDVTARAIEVKTGAVRGTANVRIKRDANVKVATRCLGRVTLANKIIRIENPNPPFKLALVQDEAYYRLGQQMGFHVVSTRPCYLHLIDFSPNGDVTLIFPNRFQRDSYIEANRKITIPGNMPFEFEAIPPAGLERVKAICTEKKVSLFVRGGAGETRGFSDEDYKRESFISLASKSGNPKGIQVNVSALRGARGIKVKLRPLGSSAYASTPGTDVTAASTIEFADAMTVFRIVP